MLNDRVEAHYEQINAAYYGRDGGRHLRDLEGWQRREEARALLRSGIRPPFPSFVEHLGHIVEELALIGMTRWLPGGRVYLLNFEGPAQYVKAGRTTGHAVRLRKLRHQARMHGHGLFDAWVTGPVQDARGLEQHLLGELAELCPEHQGEYFHGLPFETALGIAESAALAWGAPSRAWPSPVLE
jgi:hypothetical protein